MPPPLTTTFEGFAKNGIVNKGIWVRMLRYLSARKVQKMDVLNNELVIDDQDRYSSVVRPSVLALRTFRSFSPPSTTSSTTKCLLAHLFDCPSFCTYPSSLATPHPLNLVAEALNLVAEALHLFSPTWCPSCTVPYTSRRSPAHSHNSSPSLLVQLAVALLPLAPLALLPLRHAHQLLTNWSNNGV
ncbi:hypothetical protein BDQ12DRAFT_671439 [Crucibulum laeve]|uniref:Uncharacterized protein n=1 Tax=Crucibulum laeve TaxID=68775 RepID=A0A5C3LH92_9AGAR|nr:hypothetical protein BDQ12DRAFT_671439 [Crucibulum laeve]